MKNINKKLKKYVNEKNLKKIFYLKMREELFIYKNNLGEYKKFKIYPYNKNINYMDVGKQIHNFFYTCNIEKLVGILSDENYNILNPRQLINLFVNIYYYLREYGFIKYEIGVVSRPDMCLCNNKNKIPLEIKTSIYNKISKETYIQLYKHMIECKTDKCYLLFINPNTLYEYNKKNNIKKILFKFTMNKIIEI